MRALQIGREEAFLNGFEAWKKWLQVGEGWFATDAYTYMYHSLTDSQGHHTKA